MQHIVHVFCGEGLRDLAGDMARLYRESRPDENTAFFSVLSLVDNGNGGLRLDDMANDTHTDNYDLRKDSIVTDMVLAFNDMYNRKVNIATPGNMSMTVMIWARLFESSAKDYIDYIAKAVDNATGTFYKEVIGFDNDAVTIFNSSPRTQDDITLAKNNFDNNVAILGEYPGNEFVSRRIISNRNLNGLALNLDVPSMARIAAEFAAIHSDHYPALALGFIRNQPFESFGISAVWLDRGYFLEYLHRKTLQEALGQQNIQTPRFNINGLNTQVSPIIKSALTKFKEIGDTIPSDLDNGQMAAQISAKVNAQFQEFENAITALVTAPGRSIFEREALLALILGEDSTRLEVTRVNDDEYTIDNLLAEAVEYFVHLEDDVPDIPRRLNPIPDVIAQSIRKRMRNNSCAIRERVEQLDALAKNNQLSSDIDAHFNGNDYDIGGQSFKVDLEIDREAFPDSYNPKKISGEASVDLRDMFRAVRDQGPQGSCSTFAVTSVIEAMGKTAEHLSPAFLYYHVRKQRGETGMDEGSRFSDVVNVATQLGVCKENLMPYKANNVEVPSAEADSDAPNQKIVTVLNVAVKKDDIRSALNEGFPVVIGAEIFNSFGKHPKGYIQMPTTEDIKNANNNKHHYHALVICGFDDSKKLFLVRNSWGKKFGDNGYCYMPYTYAEKYLHQAFIITEVAIGTATPTVNPSGHSIQTLRFNQQDADIQRMVLTNLNEEEERENRKLNKTYADFKTITAENTAKLINVNTQKDIVEAKIRYIEEQKQEINKTVDTLINEKPVKLKAYWKDKITNILIVGGLALLLWIIFLISPLDWLWWSIFPVVPTLVCAYLCSRLYIRVRNKKRELDDEIQREASRIGVLNQQILDIKKESLIYGKLISHINGLKNRLVNDYRKREAFSKELISFDKENNKRLAEMTPCPPYPFVSIIDNDGLDTFYNQNNFHRSLLDSVDWNVIIGNYQADGTPLALLDSENNPVVNTINNQLDGFAMNNFISGTGYAFLPPTNQVNAIVQSLDQRATPFSANQPPMGTNIETHILFPGANFQTVGSIAGAFQWTPNPISSPDPDRLTILKISRFDIA